jgi:hypothetical protein
MAINMSTEQKLPFHIVPTSIRGVYSFVPPPKGTDLSEASRRDLIKHGVLMRRPDPEKEPQLFALWRRFVTEIWTEEKFTLPTFGPKLNIPHNLKGGRLVDGSILTDNWSGIAVVGKWVGAMGVWQVPSVSQPSTPAGPEGAWLSASWVGLDGGGSVIPGTSSQDVLQAGVAQYVDATGQASYFAWYEWFVPNLDQPDFPYTYPIPITSVPVTAGDEISVVVQYVGKQGDNIGDPTPPAGPYHFGGVLLTNVTTNKAVNLYLPPPVGASFAGDCAEWIMECPDGPSGGTLPKFSPITFRDAGACNVGDALPGGEIGIELQNAFQVQFLPTQGDAETSQSGNTGMVQIDYKG